VWFTQMGVRPMDQPMSPNDLPDESRQHRPQPFSMTSPTAAIFWFAWVLVTIIGGVAV